MGRFLKKLPAFFQIVLSLAPAVFGVTGLTAVLLYSESFERNAPQILVKAGISQYHVEHYWTAEKSNQIRSLSFVASIVLIVVGIVLWHQRAIVFGSLAGAISRLKDALRIRSQEPAPTSVSRIDFYSGLTSLLIAAIIMVIAALQMPIRCDEAAMYDSVCSSILPVWAVAYISPNNHVGYSLFVWLGHFIWHDNVAGMRIFSILSWMVSALVLSQIYLELFRTHSLSLIAVAMTAPMIMTLGVLARGYSLGALLIYIALLVALRQTDLKDLILGGLIAGVALWVVPSMLYGVAVIAGLTLWRHWDQKNHGLRLALCFVGASILGAAVLYAPVILVSGWRSLIANQYVVSRPLSEISNGYVAWLASFFKSAFPTLIVLATLMIAALQRLIVKPSKHLLALSLIPLAVFILPLLQGVLPPSRTLIFMIPLILIFWGGSHHRNIGMAYGVLALAASFFIVWHGTGLLRNDVAGASDSAPSAAQVIALHPGETVETAAYDGDYACLRFYLRRAGWNGSVKVSEQFAGPWLFESNLKDGLTPEGYQSTSVAGLYKRKPKREARVR